jgi:hypothetical protein
MAKFIVTDIDWDTTNDNSFEEIKADDLGLPDEVIVNTEYLDIEDDENMDEVENAISDYLSDEYGFCHNGFTFYKT